ncbi:MAG: sarcosine oxidase subunit gamma family protein, partial [Hyphomicrobiales bacterium]
MAKFSAIHALGDKETLVRSQEGAPVRIELAEFGSLVQLFAKKGKEGAVMKKLGFKTEAGKGASEKGITYLPLAPGQWLVVADRKKGPAFGEELAKAVKGIGHVSEQSASRIRIRISGENARDLMARGCRLDLHASASGAGFTAQTVMAQVGVTIYQKSNKPEYDLYVYSGFARSFWHWLTHTAEQFGYEVV